jgi:hypothetical protein
MQVAEAAEAQIQLAQIVLVERAAVVTAHIVQTMQLREQPTLVAAVVALVAVEAPVQQAQAALAL